ncbi:hypothetical protein FOCC_FOCC009324 [Frankliniella occidentalis]|uniref:Uncharacterized protein LOC127748607 n=1 Tax=Frankliniella occidentalis TaxID=133901 RepID=A0A9C6U288_FRAOC|nr:uncharacterized protein LOC127748607 [Frankliniella occidentalis]KAE8744040.1 hypothetical protein FOCC_FOCC009324 [Frankliniella occidentalis]
MSDSGDTEADGSTANLAEGEGGKSDSKKKIIRLLTVMAYVSAVSGSAFMLSMYYLFLWEPKVAEHHLRADPNSHQALALQGHHSPPRGAGDYWQLGPHDAHSPYRPPGTPEAFPIGAYRPLAPALGPPASTHQRPYQDLPPVWMHAPPPPPRPPSLSQVRADSVLLDRIAAIAGAPSESPPLAPESRAPVTLHRRRPILDGAPEEAPASSPSVREVPLVSTPIVAVPTHSSEVTTARGGELPSPRPSLQQPPPPPPPPPGPRPALRMTPVVASTPSAPRLLEDISLVSSMRLQPSASPSPVEVSRPRPSPSPDVPASPNPPAAARVGNETTVKASGVTAAVTVGELEAVAVAKDRR